MNEALIVTCPACHRRNRLPADRLAAAPNCGACGKPLFSGKPVALDGSSFQAHTQGDLPLLVDFWGALVRAVPTVRPGIRTGRSGIRTTRTAGQGEYRE